MVSDQDRGAHDLDRYVKIGNWDIKDIENKRAVDRRQRAEDRDRGQRTKTEDRRQRAEREDRRQMGWREGGWTAPNYRL